ncbi:hypothetical protein BCR33DRAFT_720479 [Rhizoclosmatium globosum]|uniref:Uncharacterized protein n=1 Tax=Rhizoclosmatium globosum TaxID=329046 RepID=A0A1Y2BVK9_9FUNG|nr:hypothetical protein BCR33DRAFT_720479 [Rhizoclosmatium globosum]|eukprot:ORY38801.1 hypothetical protein BCR33DRAFT_720479 [Rhizoclosmatium globosum]
MAVTGSLIGLYTLAKATKSLQRKTDPTPETAPLETTPDSETTPTPVPHNNSKPSEKPSDQLNSNKPRTKKLRRRRSPRRLVIYLKETVHQPASVIPPLSPAAESPTGSYESLSTLSTLIVNEYPVKQSQEQLPLTLKTQLISNYKTVTASWITLLVIALVLQYQYLESQKYGKWTRQDLDVWSIINGGQQQRRTIPM